MKKLLIGLAVLNAVMIAGMVYLFTSREDEVVYIDSIALFKDYKFKQDLEKSTEADLLAMKHQLDSVGIVVKAHPGDSSLQRMAAGKQEEWLQAYNKVNAGINQQVWERLDPVVKEFGNDRHYKIILGANGTGTLLYAKSGRDITREFTDYANKKYENAD